MPSDTVEQLLSELTLAEKVRLTHGATDTEGTATGFVPGVERLDVPAVRFSDGPLGVRTDEPATAFPASTALSSSFDPELAREFARALGREAQGRNQDVLLGPGLNLIRVPHCGRNFEYYAEDPVVTGRFAAAVVDGIESTGVVATPKHFVANNQETARATVSAEIDERVLRELYLPGFRDAVGAGAGAVMSSYNRVDGTYMSEHGGLLTDTLKGEWGFEGVVMSDWFGTESVVGTANGGLDLQMPGISAEELMESMGAPGDDGDDGGASGPEDGDEDFDAQGGSDYADGMPDPTTGGLYGEELADAVEAGEVPESRLDDMVRRLLTQLERHDLLDGSADAGEPEGAVDTPDHRDLAERIATRGTVLLDNDGVLPLADDADVAVIGPNVDEAILGGGGSSETTPFTETSPVEGIEARAAGPVSVARGHPRVEDISLFDAFERDDGEESGDESGADVSVDDAVAAAEDADVALVFVRDQATEAADRETLALPGDQDDLIEAVAAANDRTVVVANTSGPFETPWREDVAAVVASWYPGQAHGSAAAAVLYGDSDPGGRLPVTFAPEDAYPTAAEHRYPGVDGEVHYDEGLLVGYRYFDAADAEPTYPFGHGRSYATFQYRDAEAVDDSTVELTVENTADRAGRTVVQAYVDSPTAPDDLERPPRELGGFRSLALDAGESRRVTVDVDERAFGRYDAESGWTVDSGDHVVSLGSSSRDRPLDVTIER
ncbi:glycoside hydrolase family 3 C-terminal domain-containing protein [Halosimplex litoreum]|uniref:Glycoside hydrolase family 3 C-terminal domain-containing protein n=1 Tax=Halosimplex litoreum TaxID=1198301 RepID=A0A7T3FZJ0_9EURY|nr:glycoside hydrolase family 3 C-terminal domain-containing protein [Halosimplex litoreum]QPV63128.1 glycoside hydrolase family 3 C-terminal domain-containing protein [Halosimplex litoreum]